MNQIQLVCISRLKRAMSGHTQLNPVRRVERLRTFNRRLQTTAESVKVLTDWHMTLDQNLVEVQGRVIAPQKIVFSRERYVFISMAIAMETT